MLDSEVNGIAYDNGDQVSPQSVLHRAAPKFASGRPSQGLSNDWRTFSINDAAVNGLGRKIEGECTIALTKGSSLYPDMNRIRRSGRTAEIRLANSTPPTFGITTSVSTRSTAPGSASKMR